MANQKYVFPLEEADEKITHGGSVVFRILLDEAKCGVKNFSFLVNTMKAGLNCNMTGTGHKHDEEHSMYVLAGSGGISINGEKYPLKLNDAVFVPAGDMHFVWADPGEDFTYIVIYAPPGPEKQL